MYRKALFGTAAFGLLAVLTVSIVAASPGDGDSQAFGFLVSALTDAQDKGLMTDAVSDSMSGWFVENVIAPHTDETPEQVRDRLSVHGKTSFEILILTLTDAHEKGLLTDSISDLISEWVVENVIAPGTGETPEEVRKRLSASPTPSPTPTATPTRTPTIPFADLEYGAYLEDKDPAAAKRIRALPWVADGVVESERQAAEALIWAAIRRPDTFDALLGLPWALDDVTSHESIAIYRIRRIASRSQNLAIRLMANPWVRDGITPDEAQVIYSLHRIVRAEDDSLQQKVIEKAIEILDMPFLDSVESPDELAMRSLERLEGAGSAEFLRIMAHPTLSDGITDEEAKIVMLLGRANYYKPESVRVILDSLLTGTGVYKQERAITLPHSGEVLLAVIRMSDHGGPNIDYLEHAIRHHEGFMREPLPTNYVVWYFDDYTASGAHYTTHIISNPDRDPATGEYWRAPRHAAHESGHYYWRNSQAWVSEGAADMLVILSENERVGRPLVHNREQCVLFDTISEIADAPKGSDAYTCSYSLGQRLFLDLYLALGEATFQAAFRSLYLKRLRDDPTDDCEGLRLGICHVESAFKHGASADVVAKVDKVIGHWYYGRTGVHQPDRAELVALYQATGGANWTDNTNWLSDTHIGEWHGVATDADGRVIELDLSNNGLSGQLPSRLGNLANLKELLLNYNRLRGAIPSSLGSLAQLTRLELEDNELTGAIPSSMGSLINLTRLELGDNQLSGAIPSSMGGLVNLTRLELDDNRLTGAIPSSMGNLAALRYLRLADGNRFTGCAPAALANAANNDLARAGLRPC